MKNMLFFKWNLVLFTIYSYLHKFFIWSPDINQNAKKAQAGTLTNSTFGIYRRFRSAL